MCVYVYESTKTCPRNIQTIFQIVVMSGGGGMSGVKWCICACVLICVHRAEEVCMLEMFHN